MATGRRRSKAGGTDKRIAQRDAGKSEQELREGTYVALRRVRWQELVDEPFARLIREKQLVSSRYEGFWLSMDTFKDKQVLDDLYFNGQAPWEVWKQPEKGADDPTRPIGR